MAELAGVSQSTVSYVMTGKRPISAATRAKVEAAMAQLRFHPNAGARALAGRRTNVIGLVVRLGVTTDMAGVLPFIDTVTSEAAARDFDVVLVTAEDGTASMLRLAGRSLVDAIVLMDIQAHDERLATAATLGIPVVLIGLSTDNHGLDAVDFDFRRAGALAVEELVASGQRRIVVLGEPPEVAAKDFGFVAGFEDGAVEAARLAEVPIVVLRPEVAGWRGMLELAPRLLEGREDGLGIVARTPQAITWVQQLMFIERLEPGHDIALVGLCTDALAQSFSVPVTNVSPEPDQVSRVAMARVFDLLDTDRPAGRIHLVPPRLTHRETTPPRGDR
ncbi:LacI family DNA-binding transcriptional regulator [Cellulomonas endophytica]|uniref:LacI family DNA-binding transcriptional regulator n=1 Tax=Cellulomonas endophytica TaxID=2494735 RepID=UPI0013E98736|nr:LacI family DNA-binding transcriptional regulator [Cellulomonas endophytica]